MKTLPQYWCVKNDGSPLFRQTVIKYLNDSYHQNWTGDSQAYYGYDGGSSYGGSNSWSIITHFEQKMTILTVEDFLGYFSPEDFPKVDPSVFKATRPTNSFIINVPKL